MSNFEIIKQKNKEVIKQIMKDLNINEFFVEYNGSGDEGYIESSSINTDLIDNNKNQYTLYFLSNVIGPDRNYHLVENSKQYNTSLFIENYCCNTLEEIESGWEINSGSNGVFTFNLIDDVITIKLTHHAMYEEYEEHHNTF